jgi:hypothetical protein
MHECSKGGVIAARPLIAYSGVQRQGDPSVRWPVLGG